MEKLIDIREQAFFYSTIERFVESCDDMNKCAVILSKSDVVKFCNTATNFLGKNVNLVVVVGSDVNELFDRIKKYNNVMTIAATDVKNATRIVLNSSQLIKNIIFINNDSSSDSISGLLNLIGD